MLSYSHNNNPEKQEVEIIAEKQKIICFDSDGCVIDSMTMKHEVCFGPCLVKEWGLEEQQDEVLAFWQSLNLYSPDRGINRFQGLLKTLKHFNVDNGEGLEPLENWLLKTSELSNDSLLTEIEGTDAFILKKSLSWSLAVNREIEKLPKDSCKPFHGAFEGIKSSKQNGLEIAVVSSANKQAVTSEWQKYGLLKYVDILMTQEYGTKAICIKSLLNKGYLPEDILMVGDGMGDLEAAKKNQVCYFPIIAGQEESSWQVFLNEIVTAFKQNRYQGRMMDEWVDQFVNALKKEVSYG